MSLFIVNGLIYEESQTIKGFIRVDDGKITNIGYMHELPDLGGHDILSLASNQIVIPGMIDVHIHGTSGVDVMDGTLEALTKIAQALPKEGTTSFLATTITQRDGRIKQVLKNVAKYMEIQQSGKAECVGIHLEGPFIATEQAGAQPLEYVQSPNIRLFQKWQQYANGNIRIITLAPEVTNGMELTQYAASKGVIVSIGHSNATYQQTISAIKKGVTHITHLFNCMTGLHHRELGVVGAALLHEGINLELIADGVHICPEMIQLVYNQVSSKRLILITDSIRAKWLKDGKYDLGGQNIKVKGKKAHLSDGTLAGSTLKMNEAFKNFKVFTDCSIEELIQMTSLNPAKELGLEDRKGSISLGKDADLVILNDSLEVEMTICQGAVAYAKENILG